MESAHYRLPRGLEVATGATRSFPVIIETLPSVAAASTKRARIAVLASDPELRERILAALPQPGVAVDGSVDSAPHTDLLVLLALEPSSADVAHLRGLKRARPTTHLLVVCGTLSARSARRTLEAGVGGLVLLAELEATLGPTVVAVLAGQVVVPQVGRSLRPHALSFREKQIIALAALGYTNSQIGARLYLAESTVKSHLSSAFAKLGVGSRSEVAKLVFNPAEPLSAEIMKIAGELDAAQVPSAA